MYIRRLGRLMLDAITALPCVSVILISVLISAIRPNTYSRRPRLLWGVKPIKSITYTSRALRAAGFDSQTVVIELYSIVSRDDFDHCLVSRLPSTNPVGYVIASLKAYWFFAVALHRFDVFHYFFDGGVLQRTALGRCEFALLKFAGKKLVVMPYGSDSFVYDNIPNSGWRHALYLSYPEFGHSAGVIERQIRRGSNYADCVVGCLVHTVNLPRVDVLPLVWYPIDIARLMPVLPVANGPIRIAHAPNHRGPKGTEYFLAAVERLCRKGHNIEVLLIEGKTNEQALKIMRDADILVDQLIFGYALAALEGMALGKIVVTGVSPEAPEYVSFKRYSYLDECPAVPASPESIYSVLAALIDKRSEWPAMGLASREFMEKRHSFAAAAALFQAIYAKIWEGRAVDLPNLFHPLLEKTILEESGAGYSERPGGDVP